MVKKKVEPLPTVLSTQVVPPISSVSRLEITSPSPVQHARAQRLAPWAHRMNQTPKKPGSNLFEICSILLQFLQDS